MDVSTDRWVLIVEDNPDDEMLTRRAFSNTSRAESLVLARDGEEALQALKERPQPALVLLDLKLPRLSGVEVLMALKDDRRFSTLPVVVLTSSAEKSDIAACYELGCSAFVRKPIDFNEFMKTLATTLDFWLNVNRTLGETPAISR